MAYSHRLVADAVGAEFVGGELIARIAKKHISIGRKTQDGGFVYSKAGLELANKIEREAIDGVIQEEAKAEPEDTSEVSTTSVKKGKAKRGRKPKETVVEPEQPEHKVLTDEEIEALLNAEALD